MISSVTLDTPSEQQGVSLNDQDGTGGIPYTKLPKARKMDRAPAHQKLEGMDKT